MDFDRFIVTAPGLGKPHQSEAETLGALVWLMLHIPEYQAMPLTALSRIAIPPIKRNQYLLLSERREDGVTQPVAYVSWAAMSATAEARYLRSVDSLEPDDWTSGDREWIVDWFAPFGHSRHLRRVMVELCIGHMFRTLYHRGDERGLRVLTFRGKNVSLQQQEQWWAARPISTDI